MSSIPSNGFETPFGYATSAGGYKDQALQMVRDIDSAMRVNYSANLQRISTNIYPMLYAESTFDGGRYTLVVDADTSYVHENVPPLYDETKAISHIPLGIFSILSAYAEYPALKQWVPALQAYLDQVRLVLANFDILEMPDFYRDYCRTVLEKSIAYMDGVLRTQGFTLAGFSAYARALAGEIGENQAAAAGAQFNEMNQVLRNWKGMIGEDAWDKMYVVVSAIWTLSQESAHELIIKANMKPELREAHVLVSEAVPTLQDAKVLLARVIGDRIMAELVFNPAGSQEEQDNIASLSTKRDLLSKALEKYTGDVGRATCPVAAASGR